MRNLLKNWDAHEDLTHWECDMQGDGGIIAESDPENTGNGCEPLSGLDIGTDRCWAASYNPARMSQTVDLIEEGLAPETLDETQPPIHISVWTAARFDCGSKFEIWVSLLGEEGDTIGDMFHQERDVEEPGDNTWVQITHVFENYGEGVRKVKFEQGGNDKKFWGGHFGPKMAAPSVTVDGHE